MSQPKDWLPFPVDFMPRGPKEWEKLYLCEFPLPPESPSPAETFVVSEPRSAGKSIKSVKARSSSKISGLEAKMVIMDDLVPEAFVPRPWTDLKPWAVGGLVGPVTTSIVNFTSSVTIPRDAWDALKGNVVSGSRDIPTTDDEGKGSW